MHLGRHALIVGIVSGGAAVLLSYVAVSLFRTWALSRKLLDQPNERSSHVHPVPRGGGVVLVGMALLGLALFGLIWGASSWRPVFGYAAGAILVAAISWVDDVRNLRAEFRLCAHAAAAAVLLLGTGTITSMTIPLYGTVELGYWGISLATLWILGMTNAYNFMDGIDGMAAGQAVLTSLGWAVLGWFADSPLVFGFSSVLAGAALGFLLHNWSPATIFMGDVGSAFLGYTFAALPLLTRSLWASDGTEKLRLPLMAIICVWPFLFDTSITLTRRILRRENILESHRGHFYQRLVAVGYSHSTVTLVYLWLALLGVASGLIWVATGQGIPLLTVPLLGLGIWGAVYVRERKPADGDGKAA